MDILDHIAHITLADGTKIQVLNEAGDDWDEAATHAAVAAHLSAVPPAPDFSYHQPVAKPKR